MFKQRHISFIASILLVLGALFGGAGFLLVEDTENLEKRELEEKLKEASETGKEWANQLEPGGDDHPLLADICLQSSTQYFTASLTAQAPPCVSFIPTQPLFLLYCCLKLPGSFPS